MITLKFSIPGQKRICFYSKKEFVTGKFEYIISDNGQPVSREEAIRRGFEVDPSIRIPLNLSDRGQLSAWLTDELKLDKNSQAYFDLYKRGASYLPAPNFLKKSTPSNIVYDYGMFEGREPGRPDLFTEAPDRFKSEYERIEKQLKNLEVETIKELLKPEKTALHCKRDGGGTMVCRGEKAL